MPGIIALYVRVSTSEQDPKNQADRLQAVATARGYEKYTLYLDIASGANPRRPALDQMLKDAKCGEISHIISTKLDRLARSTINLLSIMKQLESWNVTVEFLDQPIDTSTPSGKMMLTVLGAMAEFEKELIRDRTKDGLARAKAQGKVGGRPKRELSAYQIAKAKELIAENPNISQTELAEQFSGISRATLIKLLKEEGII